MAPSGRGQCRQRTCQDGETHPSQSALDATQTGYEVGTRNIVDVLNSQQKLYLSQFQYAKARYTYVVDTLLLKQSVGTLNPEDLYALSRFLDKENTISRNTSTTR